MRVWILIFFCYSMAGVQAQINSFQCSFHGAGTSAERANAVQQTTDGGYIFTGTTNGFGAGSYDMYLAKTNSNGDTLWTRTFGGSAYDVANCVIQTSDGGFVVTGATNSFSGTIFNDVYLIKTDINGNTQWTKTYGGTDTDEGYQVQQTTDGGFIIVGTTESYGVKSGDVYLLRIDSNANLLWTKTYGGTSYDVANSLVQTLDGGFVIAGSADSFEGNYNMYLIRTDMNGDTLWTRTYGGTGDDEGISILQNNTGDYVVAGYTTGFGAGNGDIYLVDIDTNGILKWSKAFGGTGYDIGYFIDHTPDGGYVIAGTTASFGAGSDDMCLLKIDSDGNPFWTKAYGGANHEYCFAARPCADAGYIIAGYSKSFGGFGEDAYLVKTDSNGASGCNEISASMMQSSTATLTYKPFTQVFSGGVMNAPASIIGGGGTQKVLCSVVGIEEDNANDNLFTVSPNPGNGMFTFQSINTKRFTDMEVYNIMGEKIFSSDHLLSLSFDVNISLRSKGVYFYKTVLDNKYVTTGKLIVE